MDWLTQDSGLPRGLALLLTVVVTLVGFLLKKRARVVPAPPPPVVPPGLPVRVETSAAEVQKIEADTAAAVEEARTKPLEPVQQGEVPEFEQLRDVMGRKS